MWSTPVTKALGLDGYNSGFYKAASETIGNDIVEAIHQFFDTRGALVARCSILHNILLCQDIVKHYEWKNCPASCLLKLDLRKAYDMMDWDFITNMMIALKFPETFISIVYTCISTAQFAIMLNGQPSQ
ncbi:uncharacterized protein LOC130815505 [Amaranthus tricolor]|uniref:uncharacterized protein LOC130815505 n=1 Tax=Amaranthus tricolor TaxID=29722 RepID=UPI002584FFB1|nr:uncharacterized protein LOC130815505 [Amaranthus tricolor]